MTSWAEPSLRCALHSTCDSLERSENEIRRRPPSLITGIQHEVMGWSALKENITSGLWKFVVLNNSCKSCRSQFTGFYPLGVKVVNRLFILFLSAKKAVLLQKHFINIGNKPRYSHTMWNNVPNKLGRQERFVQKGALVFAQPPTGQQGTKQALWRKWNGEEKKKKQIDEIFPISEANRLLSPSLADVCGWLLLFDGANLNILPVPWDCCLCLSECDNTQKGLLSHPLPPDEDFWGEPIRPKNMIFLL